MEGPDSNPTITKLLDFLSANGWENKDKLQVYHFPDTGRGIRTLRGRNFVPDETLIDLPFRGTFVSQITLVEDKGFRKHCLDRLSDTISTQLLLSVYVLYHKHLAHDHNEDSQWKEYIDSLPISLSTPHFATEEELDCVPMIKHLVKKAIEGVFETFRRTCSQSTCEVCGKKIVDLFSNEDLLLIYYLVNSRSVYCDPRVIKSHCSVKISMSDEPNMALASFLDLFNHSDMVSTESYLYVDKKTSELRYKLETGTELDSSGQLFISYGNHDNFKLLMEYGFFIPDNKHEKIDLSLAQIVDFMRGYPKFFHEKKIEFIRSRQMQEAGSISADGLSYNLETILMIFKSAALTEKSLSELVYQQSQVPVDESINLEVELYQYLIKRFQVTKTKLDSLENLSESGRQMREFFIARIRFLTKLCSQCE